MFTKYLFTSLENRAKRERMTAREIVYHQFPLQKVTTDFHYLKARNSFLVSYMGTGLHGLQTSCDAFPGHNHAGIQHICQVLSQPQHLGFNFPLMTQDRKIHGSWIWDPATLVKKPSETTSFWPWSCSAFILGVSWRADQSHCISISLQRAMYLQRVIYL